MFFPCGQGNEQDPCSRRWRHRARKHRGSAALRPAPRAIVVAAHSKTPGQMQARRHRMVNGAGASSVRSANLGAHRSRRRRVPRVHALALALLAARVSALPAAVAANSGAGHPTGRPSGPSSICERLAARWRGLPANVIAAGLWPASSPLLGVLIPQTDTTRDQRWSPRIAPLWNAYADYGVALPWNSTSVTVMHLPGTSLFMAQAIAGSAACQVLLFVRVGRRGAVHVVRPPSGSQAPCGRDGRLGTLATVLDKPAYLQYPPRDVGVPGQRSVHITRWHANGWGRSCAIGVQLTLQYDITKTFCSTQRRVCAAARAQALVRAQQYRAWRQRQLEALGSGSGEVPTFPPDAQGSERDRRLLARVRSAMRQPRTRGAYGYHPYDRIFFVMRLMGHAYVGSVGARSPGAGHAMFVLYRALGAHSRTLRVLAGFVLRRTVTAAQVHR